MYIVTRVCGLALGLLPAFALAAAPIPAAQFAKHAEIGEAALSPTGEYLALTVPSKDGSETQLQIVPLDGIGKAIALRFGKRQHVVAPTWTADDVVTVARAELEPLLGRPVSLGELRSTRIDGTNRQALFAYIEDDGVVRGALKDTGFADIVKVQEEQPGVALVSYRCWDCGEEPDSVIYSVDTRSGKRQEIERVHELADFIFDQHGKARVKMAYDHDNVQSVSYRPRPEDDWQPMPKTLVGGRITFGRFDPDAHTLYALVSDHDEPEQLYRIDLAQESREKLGGAENLAVTGLVFGGRNGVPFAVTYDAGRTAVEYLDPGSEWARLHSALTRAFPGQQVQFINFSRGNHKLLFFVSSDRNPGAYYLFDNDLKKVQLVNELMPWIKPEQMAPMRPVEFQARDGSTLYGFYSAIGDGPKPLVVMPHGGPYGIYDDWGFDRYVQFLASRGYGVLQVNYRGSGGRGFNFVKRAWKEWGGLIQDDIADGVRWAVATQLTDAKHVCIFGASFGGYSALMSPIRYPELYRCAVGYAGIYDLQLMHKTDTTSRSKRGRAFLDREVGEDEAMLGAWSPALKAEQLKLPIMLVHGRMDHTAKFDQYRAMTAALKRNDHEFESLVVTSEGHGFYKPENTTELFTRLEAFLGRAIGGKAK